MNLENSWRSIICVAVKKRWYPFFINMFVLQLTTGNREKTYSFTQLQIKTWYPSSVLFCLFTETSRRPVTPTCARREDIVFMFDDSYSIFHNNPQNFNIMKDFMKDIVGSFIEIGRQGKHYSCLFLIELKSLVYLSNFVIDTRLTITRLLYAISS